MFNPFADAIASIESGGNYRAVTNSGKGRRAYGKYQVMGENIGPWTKEILGKELTPTEFLNNPEAQDAVFNGKFGQSVAKYGNPQDAASVWFTGRPLAQGKNAMDIFGTTGSAYVDRFNQALAKMIGGQNAAPSTPNSLPAPAAGGSSGTEAAPQYGGMGTFLSSLIHAGLSGLNNGGPNASQMPAYPWSPQQAQQPQQGGGFNGLLQQLSQTPTPVPINFNYAPQRQLDLSRLRQALAQMPAPIRGFSFS